MMAGMMRGAIAAGALLVAAMAQAQDVKVDRDGSIAMPAIDVPGSTLFSEAGNRSRVDHILTERSLKGKPIAEFNTALFGPRLARAKANYPVKIEQQTIGGVRVTIYEPAGGVKAADKGKLLINVHGGGFVGCFTECGGLESIPVAVLSGLRVVSIDYRMAPAHRFPAASEDVASVYRELLKKTPARSIGIFGCSAGGLLTAQSLAWFQSHALATPAVASIACAGADPSMAGDSRTYGFVLGDGEAPPAPRAPGSAPLGYMVGSDTKDANAYPGADAATLKRFPPTLVLTGTRDFALSSAVYLHSRLVAAGVETQLNVWEGGRHAFFYDSDVPEAREAQTVIARFLKSRVR